MTWLVTLGTFLTLAGLAGIIFSVVRVLAVRRAALPDAETKARLQKVVPLNIGALMLSFLGLICVIVGVIL